MNLAYDQERFLRLVARDSFLSRVWARDKTKLPPERRDRQLRALFNSYVVGNSAAEREYQGIGD
jgi:hypothetical protein